MPRKIHRRTYPIDSKPEIRRIKNNPTALYLMAVRNELTLEDIAKLYLKSLYDWELAETVEVFAKLILHDRAAASQEAFRIMAEEDELDKLLMNRCDEEDEIGELMVESDIELAYEELYWKEAEEARRLEEQTEREICEYMESEDSV